MSKRPGRPVRGSHSGRPIMVLLDVLGQRWTLRVLRELAAGPATFRALQARCDDVSPTVLNARLKTLRELEIVGRDDGGYRLTTSGLELGEQLRGLDRWAERWAASLAPEQRDD